MPIISHKDGGVSVEYTIPLEIKEKIPVYFYQCLAGNLFAIGGMDSSNFMFFDKENSFPYEDKIYQDLNSGTGWWYEAFKATCIMLDMKWLFKYYCSLEWYDSDLFDWEVEKGINDYFITQKDKRVNEYYSYLYNTKILEEEGEPNT